MKIPSLAPKDSYYFHYEDKVTETCRNKCLSRDQTDKPVLRIAMRPDLFPSCYRNMYTCMVIMTTRILNPYFVPDTLLAILCYFFPYIFLPISYKLSADTPIYGEGK